MYNIFETAQVKVISYDEQHDTFECELTTKSGAKVRANFDAAQVAESCPITHTLDDLPFDLIGQQFTANFSLEH